MCNINPFSLFGYMRARKFNLILLKNLASVHIAKLPFKFCDNFMQTMVGKIMILKSKSLVFLIYVAVL